MILIFLLNNETVSAIAMAAPIGSMTTSAANDTRVPVKLTFNNGYFKQDLSCFTWIFEMAPAELKSLTILYEKIGKLDSRLIVRYGDRLAFQKAQKAPKISWIDPDKG